MKIKIIVYNNYYMSSFDLSILTQLKEKFENLSSSIQEKELSIQTHEQNISHIQQDIDDLESKKSSLIITSNSLKEEKQKLTQLHQESKVQYETVKSSAEQLLSILNDETI